MQNEIKLSQESPVQDAILEKMLPLAIKTQAEVTQKISSIDGTKFKYMERIFSEKNHLTCLIKFMLIENSKLLEKGNVILTETFGKISKKTEDISYFSDEKKERDYHSISCSMVFHPNSPFIPSMHTNFYYVITEDGTFWYGGGGDLTPGYIIEEDCKKFHQQYKDLCDKYLGEGWYKRFKSAADNYFIIKHRNHRRGIGGMCFENFNDKGVYDERFPTGHTKETIFQYVKACCENIAHVYGSIVEERQHLPYSSEHIHFMKLIRSRYSEFNLMYDRGISFGIKAHLPADIPLMCMPNSHWEYDWENKYKPGSEEYKTLDILRNPRDWII